MSNAIDLSMFDLISCDKIEHVTEEHTLYDITVEEDHTFFVMSEAGPILLHNCDGSHITGLIIGFFQKFAPKMIEKGMLKKLRTPVIVLKDKKGKIVHHFFDLQSYNEFRRKHDTSKYEDKYFKGLGSWKEEEFKQLIDEFGLEYFIYTFVMDENGVRLINEWLSGRTVQQRKGYLRECEFDIFSI